MRLFHTLGTQPVVNAITAASGNARWGEASEPDPAPCERNAASALLRLPLIQERQQVFRPKRSRLFELAVLLADEQSPIPVEHRQCGNPAVHRDFILFHQVLVLVALPYVHMDDLEICFQNGSYVGPFKRQVQDVTVVAPICAEDQENAFVRSEEHTSEL